MSKKLSFILLIVCLAAVGPAFAQLTPEGRINGKVVDTQGNPLPGVSVAAASPKLIGKAVATTDAAGVYRLMALPSGTYEITFTIQGFKTLIRKGILLELSQTLALNVTLEEATLEEQVTVVGQSPLIDVKSTVKGQVMTKETYLSLPRGRTFDSLISTIPGVQNESIAGGISVDGASGAENVFFVDGADMTNFHLGIEGQNVVLELLDEVKVTASGYNAEFGGSMGGVVNVISRSGSNEFHGDLMLYYENHSKLMYGYARDYLRANPLDEYVYEYVNNDTLYFNNGDDRDKYNRFEGVVSLGGYIIKDKLWFFGSVNPAYNATDASRDFNVGEGPYSTFTNKDYGYNGSFKLTAAPATGLRLSASFINNFTKYRGAIPDITGIDDSTYEWGDEGFDYPNWTGALTADWSKGNNFLLSYRGGWHMQNTTNQQLLPPDGSTYYFAYSNTVFASDPFYLANPDLIHPSGYATTWNYFETKKYKQDKISNNLDATYFLSASGEHSFKAGIGYALLKEDVSDASTHPRTWLYWNRTYTGLGFPVGVGAPVGSKYYGQYGYYYVRGSFTSPYGGVWNIQANNWSAYLQDSWTINGKLTVNVGLRAESQYIPAMTTDSTYPGYDPKPVKFDFGQMLAPRLGAVYDVFGDSSLKIFGSFGIYYDVMKLYMAELTFGGWKRKQDYYSLTVPDWRLIAASGELERRDEPGRRRRLRRHRRLPAAFVRPGRSRPEADGAAGDLLRRREEARREPVPVRPPGQQAPPADDRGRRRLRHGRRYARAAVLRHQPRLRRLPPDLRGRPVLRRLLALPQGDARLLRRQPVPGKAVQQQLAGRRQLHLEPGHRDVVGSGQLRRRRPSRAERRAGFRPLVHGLRRPWERPRRPAAAGPDPLLQVLRLLRLPLRPDGGPRGLRPGRPARHHQDLLRRQVLLSQRPGRPGPAAVHLLGRYLPGLHAEVRQVPGLHQPPAQQRHQHQDGPEPGRRLQPGRILRLRRRDPQRGVRHALSRVHGGGRYGPSRVQPVGHPLRPVVGPPGLPVLVLIRPRR